MADTPSPEPAANVVFDIEALYVKDLSFESPHSPSLVQADWKPDVRLNLNSNATEKGADQFEVVLTATVTVALGDETAFLAEVQQAGLFRVSGLGKEELASTLGSYCPNLLFPYAREAISNMVNRGGFPALNLMPVNFDALYQQHRTQQTGAAESSG